MGILAGVRNTWRKSEAAAVIQSLLESQCDATLSDFRPGPIANELVTLVWAKTPYMFDGSRGAFPHKISLAAVALADGAHKLVKRDSKSWLAVLLAMSLSRILRDVEMNEYLYPFNTLDKYLLGSAEESLSEITAILKNDPDDTRLAPQTTESCTKEADVRLTLDPADERMMEAYGITFERGQYKFQTYCYDKLADAISYAERVASHD